ncbi:MAG: hypothetical protein M0P70_05200 [Desulfobulbaceae bacterium]|nr:hypothetical protein [Desulfobulbaceae bacterium]
MTLQPCGKNAQPAAKQAGIGQGLTRLWIWEGGNGDLWGMAERILDAPPRQKPVPERRCDWTIQA